MSRRSAVLCCASAEDFIRAASCWRDGLPFPLLAGLALDRYAAVLETADLPAVTPEARPGLVISTGSEFSRAAARLLASATRRPHRHVPQDQVLAELAACRDQLVAVVGLASELSSVGDWPGRSGARVGVLAGRSEQALACLIYRSLTVRAASAQDRVFVLSHPLLPGALEADAVSAQDFGYLRGNRPGLVVLYGQGRECSVSLLDGIVCGRSSPLDVPLPAQPGMRATPCLRGAGCFRTDLTEQDRMPAAEIQAMLVFSQSCSSVAIGTNAYPQDISLSLGLLEGTAVAVIGVLGVHVAHRNAQRDLREALAESLPLGDVVRRLEAGGHPFQGELKRFGLLGDPGLTVPTTIVGPAASQRPARLEPGTVARLARLELAAERVERLGWLEIDVTEDRLAHVRRAIRLAARDPFDPQIADAAGQIERDLGDLQHQIACQTASRAHSPDWRSLGFRQASSSDVPCPGCGRATIARTLELAVNGDVRLQTLHCRACDATEWTTEPGRPIVRVRTLAAAGGVVAVCELAGPGARPLSTGAWCASRGPHGPAISERCELGPGEVRRLRVEGPHADGDQPEHAPAVTTVALFDGILVSSAMTPLAVPA